MTLNISDALNTPIGRKRARSLRANRRAILEQAVVDEMTSWNPLEFLGTFKSMHKGSLSLVHLNVLLELATHGPMAMGRLAEGLEVSVASATGIVDRMEKNGFVERRHDDEDRRVVVVHPTDAADHVFRTLQQRRREGLGKLIESLGDRQLVGLVSGHRALRRARAKLAAGSVEGSSERPGL